MNISSLQQKLVLQLEPKLEASPLTGARLPALSSWMIALQKKWFSGSCLGQNADPEAYLAFGKIYRHFKKKKNRESTSNDKFSKVSAKGT